MLAYVVPKMFIVNSDIDARLEREQIDSEWRQAEAQRLLLPWPRSRKRRAPGRPNRQELYVDAIYRALETKSLPAGLESSNVPGWWHAGMELVRTADRAIEEMKEWSVDGRVHSNFTQ